MKRSPVHLLLALAVALCLAAALLRYLWPSPMAHTAAGVLVGLGCGLVFAAALAWKLPDACDSAPLPLRRRYVREFLPAMIAYMVAVFASVWLLKRIEEPALRALVALLPVPPVALALRAMIRYIRDVDEMQQRIELEAVGLSTALVSLLYLAGGFLQSAKVVDLRASATMLMVFPLLCGVYGIAKLLVLRRYR